jgi:DNA-binding response OmpR family regulator
MAGPRPLLIVDDDVALRATLAEQLSLDGEFEPAEAATAEEAERMLSDASNRFDAVLLDIGLPDGDGRELCTKLRRQGVKIPIIMLTGADAEQDVVRGLAILIGPYSFRPSAKLLMEQARNRKIRLTEKECAILKYLYRAGSKPVGRQILLNEVWGYNSAVTTHTLETHIYRLRQKIEPDPANSRLLLTEGGGYRLDPAAGANGQA